MRPSRLTIIDRIHDFAADSSAEEWPGERDWEAIKKSVKHLVAVLRDDPEIVTAETSRIMVSRADGALTVYVNVGTWSE